MFVDTALNSIKKTTIIEAFTTRDYVHNNTIYTTITDLESPKQMFYIVRNVKKERLKVNNKIYNINTSKYENNFPTKIPIY